MKPKWLERREDTRASMFKSRTVIDGCLRINDWHPSDTGVTLRDEPIPMKDKKTVNKHPNAADSFRDTHQAEYDDRDQPPERCRYVDSHNDAYPKLKDELDRKRDASKPVPRQSLQDICKACRERQKRGRSPARSKPKRKRRSRYSRVSKSRRKPRRRIHHKINKARSRNDEKENGERTTSDPRGSKSVVDFDSTRYSDPSCASLSSYNSFLSVGHEPMISE